MIKIIDVIINEKIVKKIPEVLFFILINLFLKKSIIFPINTTKWYLEGTSSIIRSINILKINKKIKYIFKLLNMKFIISLNIIFILFIIYILIYLLIY